MRYVDFRDAIAREIGRTGRGLTWSELRTRLRLPYVRPCPEWTKQLESDIGLTRTRGEPRALVWTLRTSRRATRPKKTAGRVIDSSGR